MQYVCREAFDVWTVQEDASIPVEDIMRKLDADFFAGRWAGATERQRDLLTIIAHLRNSAREFTVRDIVAGSKRSPQPFSPSQVSQMLATLSEAALSTRTGGGGIRSPFPSWTNSFAVKRRTRPADSGG